MFTPITVPSRSSPETFATEAELAIAGLAQFILDYNQLGSILNTAITSTSTTSLAIGTGSKSLTVQTGLNLVPGYPVRLAYTTSPTDNMDGTVTTYNSSTGALVVEVASVNGSGTYASWQVMVLPSATGNFADKSTANTFTDVQTFTGGVAANPLIKKQSDPTLGGALLLEKSSGSSLSGNLKFELSDNSIRIYENGGSSRGVTLDITTLAASIADKILTTASLKTYANDSTFSSTSPTDPASPEWVKGVIARLKPTVDQSGSRSLTTTYTNTSGDDMEVSVGITTTVQNGNLEFLVDGMRVFFLNIGNNLSGVAMSCVITVPNGSTYRANSPSSTLNYWREAKL